jgi:hypothetical protein
LGFLVVDVVLDDVVEDEVVVVALGLAVVDVVLVGEDAGEVVVDDAGVVEEVVVLGNSAFTGGMGLPPSDPAGPNEPP